MKFQIKRIAKNESGFSMVEMLLVLLLMFFVVSIITMTYFTSANASRLVIDATTAEMDARTTMYSVSREIRGASQIIEANADRITFIGGEGADQTSYFLQPYQGYYRLYKSVNGQERFVATHIISESVFSYYSSPGVELSQPLEEVELENIVIVGISTVIDRTGENSQRTMELATLVTLRNKL